jgi:2-oxoglutarate dehydrogenase E1 component
VSDLKELAEGSFHTVFDDKITETDKIKRIVFCSGKIYYDLLKYSVENKCKDVALVRVEMLYPFPEKEIRAIRAKYNNAKQIYWVQEEPENYGPWIYFKNWFGVPDLVGVYRKAGSAPATGFHKQHSIEQNEILEKALK